MQKGKIQLKIQIQIQIKQKLEYTKLPGHAGVQLHVWLQNESGGNTKHYRSEKFILTKQFFYPIVNLLIMLEQLQKVLIW